MSDPMDDLRDAIAEEVDLGGTLLDLEAFLSRFVSYPHDGARCAHVLWIAHTHCMDAWDSTPRIAFLSPEPGSGKTRALEITELLVPRPVPAINVTAAYLFRKVADEAGLPTILYDEIDTVFGPKAKENEDIRGLLNAGHRRGAMCGRAAMRGKTVILEDFPAYCAVALAGLGGLPDTILTRSVIVSMKRRAPGETVEPYRRRVHEAEGYELRDRLSRWALAATRHLSSAWPELPDAITDRNADVWEPLIAIADLAGGDWPDRARRSAVAHVAAASEKGPSLNVRLLTDIRTVFGPDTDQMTTTDLLAALIALEESPWGDLRGKPLDSRSLAHRLRNYEVGSVNVRVGEWVNNKVVKGYRRADFEDVWARYCPVPPIPEESATCATDATQNPEAVRQHVADILSRAPALTTETARRFGPEAADSPALRAYVAGNGGAE